MREALLQVGLSQNRNMDLRMQHLQSPHLGSKVADKQKGRNLLLKPYEIKLVETQYRYPLTEQQQEFQMILSKRSYGDMTRDITEYKMKDK